MDFNWTAVAAASVVMFAVGAIWYMGLFAKMWGEMFGFDKLDKKTQKQMQKDMAPFMLLQFMLTVVSAIVLTKFIMIVSDVSVYMLAFWLWLGMVFPTQVSGVIFGGTDPKWIVRKITIMSTESLAHLLAAAYVIHIVLTKY